jgi:DNA repair protein SbcD/Mre11
MAIDMAGTVPAGRGSCRTGWADAWFRQAVTALWDTPAVTTPTDGRLGTVLHAADLHLGAPLRSLGSSLPDDVVQRILDQSKDAWANLVKLAIDEQVDVVVLAGDVYDHAEYEVAAQLRFVDGLKRLVGADIRVFVAHGNHDPHAGRMKLAARLPDEVIVFSPGEPQVHPVTLRSGHGVHVAGVSFGTVAEQENLAARFAHLDTPAASTVGVLHANVGSNTGHDPYAPCTEDDLRAAPVGYWALGHIHLRQHRSLGPGRWWAYPGNLQGRSAKASECGEKGVNLVPVLETGFGEPEFRACAEVQFARVDVDVEACDDLASAIEAVASTLDAELASVPATTLVSRVRLVGRSPAHDQLRQARDAATLLDLVHQVLDPSQAVIVTRVEVATRSAFDREQAMRRGDLLSAVLERFDATVDRADALAGLLDELPGAQTRLASLLDTAPELADEIVAMAEQTLVDFLEVGP